MIFLIYIFFLGIGVYLLQFGLRVLFQKGFVEDLQKGRWKDDSGLFSQKGGFFYDKYVRGVSNVATGVLALTVGVWGLLHL